MITPTVRLEDARAEPASFGRQQRQQRRRNPKCNKSLKEAASVGGLFYSGKSSGVACLALGGPNRICTLAYFENEKQPLRREAALPQWESFSACSSGSSRRASRPASWTMKGFAVDASPIQADANKPRSIAGRDWRKDHEPMTASRADDLPI